MEGYLNLPRKLKKIWMMQDQLIMAKAYLTKIEGDGADPFQGSEDLPTLLSDDIKATCNDA
jgi:hypothetical protein